jgi:SAM-dependent methyltransferase
MARSMMSEEKIPGKASAKAAEQADKPCPLCGSDNTRLIMVLHNKPGRETDIGITDYRREIHHCQSCYVYFNIDNYDMASMYDGTYNKATYDNKIKETYDRIMAFPPEKSINKQRVDRILKFLEHHKMTKDKTTILDVGSGLCVFLGEMKKHGFKSYCIDPDPLSVRHAKENAKVDEAWQGTIEEFETDRKFSLITFNKVLEHIKEPIPMLAKAKDFLESGGVVYIELPDSKGAIEEDDFVNREEFFMGHNFIFTKESVQFLIERAGFKVLELKQVHEPGDKYTIYAFIKA